MDILALNDCDSTDQLKELSFEDLLWPEGRISGAWRMCLRMSCALVALLCACSAGKKAFLRLALKKVHGDSDAGVTVRAEAAGGEPAGGVSNQVQEALLACFGKMRKEPPAEVDMATRLQELHLDMFPFDSWPPASAVCCCCGGAVDRARTACTWQVRALATKVKPRDGRIPVFVNVDLRECVVAASCQQSPMLIVACVRWLPDVCVEHVPLVLNTSLQEFEPKKAKARRLHLHE